MRYNAQGVYITERQNECITMHRARILQKDRTNTLQCTERVYYRQTERRRYNLQKKKKKRCVSQKQRKWQNQRVVTTDDVDYRKR